MLFVMEGGRTIKGAKAPVVNLVSGGYMAKVYRVQNRSWNGPYQSGPHNDIIETYFERHASDRNHPGPQTDTGIDRRPRDNERCAFASMKSLRKWFPRPLIDALADDGFYIWRMEAKITAVGERQILIDSKSVGEAVQCSK